MRSRISSRFIFASCVRYFDLVRGKTTWDTSILYEAKQGWGVVSCTYILLLVTGVRADPNTRIQMISYVCRWGLLIFFIFHWNTYFIILHGRRYLVVGTIFFSVSIPCSATHAGRICAIRSGKLKTAACGVWPFEVIRVMLLLDRSRAWMILTGTQLWVPCGHTTVVSHS